MHPTRWAVTFTVRLPLIFLRKVIESSFLCKFVSFACCARVYETWKQYQWIMRTLACKHKLWGKKSLYLRLYLKAFPVFNVLETIDLVIVKFIKKIIEQFFWIMRYCVDMDQITCKNVTKAAEYRLITFF